MVGSTVPHGHGAARKPRQIASPITYERHSLSRQRGYNDLAQLAWGKRQVGIRIDDFKVQVSLAKMGPAMGIALDSATESHFGGSVMVEDFAAPHTLQLSDYGRGNIRRKPTVCAEQNALDLSGRYFGRIFVCCNGENLNGNAYEAVNSVLHNLSYDVRWVLHGAVHDALHLSARQGSLQKVPQRSRLSPNRSMSAFCPGQQGLSFRGGRNQWLLPGLWP